MRQPLFSARLKAEPLKANFSNWAGHWPELGEQPASSPPQDSLYDWPPALGSPVTLLCLTCAGGRAHPDLHTQCCHPSVQLSWLGLCPFILGGYRALPCNTHPSERSVLPRSFVYPWSPSVQPALSRPTIVQTQE